MSVVVPVKVIVVSAVPSPGPKLRPVVPLSVSVPVGDGQGDGQRAGVDVGDRDGGEGLVASSLIVWVPGTVLTGGSFTGLTVKM